MLATAFWTFLSSAIAVLLTVGDKQAKTIVAACLIASGITFALNLYQGFFPARLDVLFVDIALLAVAVAISLHSNSFWPMWFSGFQLIAVAARIAQIAFNAPRDGLYDNIAGFTAFPALAAAVIGVLLDRRYRRSPLARRN